VGRIILAPASDFISAKKSPLAVSLQEQDTSPMGNFFPANLPVEVDRRSCNGTPVQMS